MRYRIIDEVYFYEEPRRNQGPRVIFEGSLEELSTAWGRIEGCDRLFQPPYVCDSFAETTRLEQLFNGVWQLCTIDPRPRAERTW